jgi:hypothetical protein
VFSMRSYLFVVFINFVESFSYSYL